MIIRRDFRTLSSSQRSEIINAILELKENNASNSTYNSYVTLHGEASVMMTPSGSSRSVAHGGPAFLPWHRHITNRFELDLQQASGNADLGLPYWKWWEESDPRTASIWASDFMGGTGENNTWAVRNGPFRAGNWTIINDASQPLQYPDGRNTGVLKRRFADEVPSLPSLANVTFCMNQTRYDTSPWSSTSTGSHRNAMEGFTNSPQMHNRLHRWVGKSIRTNLAPNDPFFWIIHSTMDWLWTVWQQRYGTVYAPTTGGPTGHNIDDVMRPHNVDVRSVLDSRDLGISYDSLTL